MISGLVLKYLNGECFVIRRGYETARSVSSSFCLTVPYEDSLAQTISALGGKVWCPYFKDLTESELAKAKELGLVVNVWTVNSVSDIIRMAEMGVDGIISDYPARVQNILSL